MDDKNQNFNFKKTEKKAERKISFDDLVNEFKKEPTDYNNKEFERPKNHHQHIDYRQKSLIIGLLILALLFFRATVAPHDELIKVDLQSTPDAQLLVRIDQKIFSAATTTRQNLFPLLESMKNILSRFSSIDKKNLFYLSWEEKYINYLKKYFSWTEAETPNLLIDFARADKNFSPRQNIVLGNFLILFDPAVNAIYQIDIYSKDLQKIKPSKIILQIAKFNETSFLAIDQNKKLFLYNLKDKIWEEMEIKDGISGDLKDFFVYGNRLYVLSDNLYRYDKTDHGFGFAKPWFNEKINLEKAQQMVCDGSIYLLSETNILKFNRGKQINLNLEKIAPTIDRITTIFISEEADNIFVLADRRIIIFDKNGHLSKQISSSLWSAPQTMNVISEQNKIFVTDGQKIWRVSF